MKEKMCSCRYQDYLAETIDSDIKYSDYIKEGLENSIKYWEYSDDYPDTCCDNCYPLYLIENKIKEVLKKTKLDKKDQLLIEAHNKRIATNRKRQMDCILDDVQYIECDIRKLEEFKNWRNYIGYSEYMWTNKLNIQSTIDKILNVSENKEEIDTQKEIERREKLWKETEETIFYMVRIKRASEKVYEKILITDKMYKDSLNGNK